MSSDSKVRNVSFDDVIPGEAYLEYFDAMQNGRPIYVCTTTDTYQKQALYTESHVREKTSIARIFLAESDADTYIDHIEHYYPKADTILKVWTTTFANFAEYIIKLNKDRGEKKLKNITPIVMFTVQGVLREIDTFWSVEKKLMV
ncbi:MAG: hypothetical protein ACREGB_03640 [Candidatus Saccharimonadales bacterium]